jgi:hypothetical protein
MIAHRLYRRERTMAIHSAQVCLFVAFIVTVIALHIVPLTVSLITAVIILHIVPITVSLIVAVIVLQIVPLTVALMGLIVLQIAPLVYPLVLIVIAFTFAFTFALLARFAPPPPNSIAPSVVIFLRSVFQQPPEGSVHDGRPIL